MTLTQLLFPSSIIPRAPLQAYRRCVRLIVELRDLIPSPLPLTGKEEEFRGYLFEDGPIITERVIWYLQKNRELFVGHADADVLLDQHKRAYGWRVLGRALRGLADRAEALDRLEQAGATRHALQILRTVRERSRSRLASADDRLRACALDFAEGSLRAWQIRKGGRCG